MLVNQLKVLDKLPRHRQLLERAVTHFEKDERVIGLIIAGSIAHNRMDAYSDIDLGIIVHDNNFETVFEERETAAAAIEPPLFGFVADHIPLAKYEKLYIVLYEGPVKVDFGYIQASGYKPNWRKAKQLILKDTNGLLTDVISQSQGLTMPPPPPERILDLNQKFWTWCWYMFGKIMRGELWEALGDLNFIREMALVVMLDWVIYHRYEGYRRLESKLTPELEAKFKMTIAEREPESLYAALQAEIELYRELHSQVYARYNLVVDPKPEQVVIEAMNQRWAERSNN